MTQLCLVLLGLSVGVTTASARNFVPFFGREQRSLVNTFPFNNVDDALPARETRQGLDNSISSIPFTAVAASYAGGKRWVAGAGSHWFGWILTAIGSSENNSLFATSLEVQRINTAFCSPV